MRYYGGKCYWGGWISTLLPKNLSGLYVEPFGGMLSVLLRREKAAIEIVNDLDRRLMTWWEIVRDRPDELVRLLDYTPYSRAVFAECAEICDSPKFNDPLKLAWALTVILWQGYGAKNTRPSWARHIAPISSAKMSIFKNIDILHRRLEYVQLDCSDACTLLERVADRSDALIYCDPPYRSADTSAYLHRGTDWARMVEILRDAKAAVAISGYSDEWDITGWQKSQKSTSAFSVQSNAAPDLKARFEILWRNEKCISELADETNEAQQICLL